jgi:hypothetical protein
MHQFQPFLAKMKRCCPLLEHPTKSRHSMGDGVPAPLERFCSPHWTFEHKSCSGVILLLDGEDFLLREEDVFVPIPGVPLEETLCSCPSDRLSEQQ